MQAQSFSGVLSESNTNKQVLSPPGQSVTKAEKTQVSTPRNHLQRTLMATSNKEQHSPSSLCLVINSPSRARNTESHLANNETNNENFSMYISIPPNLNYIYIFLFLYSCYNEFASPSFTDSVELHSGEVLNLPRRGNHRFT